MGKSKKGSTASTSSPSAKRSRSLMDSPTQTDTSSSYPEVSDTLISIEHKLSALDNRIALIELIHKEFQQLKHSLEYSHDQIHTLTEENSQLKTSIQSLTTNLATVTSECKHMKETILDLQSRSMRDDLIFSGISETPNHSSPDPETVVKNFLLTKLKIPSGTVDKITFHHVHRLGSVKKDQKHPHPIIVKFEHYKHKELVKKQGQELKGTHYGMNDQFPREIQERRKTLFPIRRKFIHEGKKAIIAVDKLYIDGQLYRDSTQTPWLY